MAGRRSATSQTVPFLVLILFGSFVALVIHRQYLDFYDDLAQSTTVLRVKKSTSIKSSSPATVPVEPPKTSTLPAVITLPLKVPYTSQAPLAVWDPLHEEACEEASLLMVYYYRTGQKFTTPLEADAELKKLVAWEEDHGYKVDLTAKELIAVADSYLKLKTGRIITDPTIDQLKAELNAGRPVIVPAAGRELKNPYFTSPGPIYHMLVLKGYDSTGFIANDPGTRRGESYHYAFKRIMDAIHDWDPDQILNGKKVAVVFD